MAPPNDELRDELKLHVIKCVNLYFKTKKLITVAERHDTDQKVSISCIAELRSAFDHLMRVEKALLIGSSEYDDNEASLKNYCLINYSKTMGHLYRAAYDSYDAISISLIKETRKLLLSHFDLLLKIDKDIGSSAHKILNDAQKQLSEAKCRKDIEEESEQLRYFELYEDPCNKLSNLKEKLIDLIPAIEALQKKETVNEWKQRGIGLIAGALLVFLSWYLKSKLG